MSILKDIDVRNPYFVACEQQRRRPDCKSAQSDQCLSYSISGVYKAAQYKLSIF